jgi:hypothetical protein
VSNQDNIVHQKPEDQKNIDLNNITKGEVNDLIKSGFDDLLFMLPVKSIFDGDGSFSKNDSNEKFDLVGQLKGMIEFQKGIGESTKNLEEALDKYSNIHGKPFPKRIDMKA